MAIRQITRKTALLSAIAFFVLTGVIFLLATIYLALARAFGDIHAALFVALGCFALAFIGFIAIKILDARRRRRQVREHTRVDGSAVLTATALAVLPELMKRPLIAAAMPIIGLAAYAFLFNGEGTPKNRRRQE
ncbi:hypothetical protein [Phyllobacterium leguminum]|uniref:hypothetical protein n=1 Tax=Phyllobacterium leguminum TaxID=314237 RepID=UPI0011B42FC5|nr:hypothetical protein [Phyllobacterium leguminum]